MLVFNLFLLSSGITTSTTHIYFFSENCEVTAKQEKTGNQLEQFHLGYQECMSETMQFLVESEGFFSGDSLCVRLMNHLTKHCEKILTSKLFYSLQLSTDFLFSTLPQINKVPATYQNQSKKNLYYAHQPISPPNKNITVGYTIQGRILSMTTIFLKSSLEIIYMALVSTVYGRWVAFIIHRQMSVAFLKWQTRAVP